VRHSRASRAPSAPSTSDLTASTGRYGQDDVSASKASGGSDERSSSGEWGATVLDREYDRATSEVIYWDILREQVIALNDDITEDNADSFLNSLRRNLDHESLMTGNRAFHNLLRTGKKFNVKHENNSAAKSTYIDPINFEQPENNRHIAADQFRVSRTHSIRPD